MSTRNIPYETLLDKIIAARNVIIWHAAQVGDDRCWLDDWRVYKVILGLDPPSLPEYAACMQLCRQYWEERREDALPAEGVNTGTPLHYPDLAGLPAKRVLEGILNRLIDGAIRHHEIGDGMRTKEHDRLLYALVPGDIRSNQTLPPKEVLLHSCEKFISSRDRKNPKLHEW